MKILITGVAGFVGTNFSNYLLDRGHEVVGIDLEDRHSRLKASSLMSRAGFSFLRLDLAKETLKNSELGEVDIIFHFAALPHVDYSRFYPHRVVSNNIESLLNVIEFACSSETPLVFSSSVEVYGGSEDKIYTTDDVLAPLSPYAASKVAGEAVIEAYIETQSLHATILRFTNLYGKWQAPDRLLPRIISQIISGEEVTIEKGTNRDFVFVEDACELLEKFVDFDHKGEIYNLSSGVRYDNYEAVEHVLTALPTDAVKIVEPRTNDGRGKYLVASPDKLYNSSGWKTKTDLKKGVTETIKWYRDNVDWLSQFENHVNSDRTTDKFLTDSNLNLPYWSTL